MTQALPTQLATLNLKEKQHYCAANCLASSRPVPTPTLGTSEQSVPCPSPALSHHPAMCSNTSATENQAVHTTATHGLRLPRHSHSNIQPRDTVLLHLMLTSNSTAVHTRHWLKSNQHHINHHAQHTCQMFHHTRVGKHKHMLADANLGFLASPWH